MPLTLRSKDQILDTIISSLLAGNIVSDVNPISFTRQISEGVAATQADLDYELYILLKSWYVTSAEGVDLDVRGNDFAVARDAGQAASDPVTFYPLLPWIDDIPLSSPQVVQATLVDGTQVLYRSLGDLVLLPSGRSISGQGPATALTSGVDDHVILNLDSDGSRSLFLGTQTTGVGIAASLQAAVQALVAINPSKQSAYNTFRSDYSVTTPGAYTLRSGTPGITSSVVVTAAVSADASVVLKLGLDNGGLESVGQANLDVPMLSDTIGVLGNVGAGQINELVGSVPGIERIANVLMFSNGRAPASDDAYRQDIRTRLESKGRGNEASVEMAVHDTLGSDRQRHVMTSQVLYGASNIQVYVCDGRSLTVGAQADVVQDVQDELDGLGEEPGGWIPSGNSAGVAPATVLTVDVDVDVYVGLTPDLARGKVAVTNALYTFLYQSGVGQLLTLVQLDGVIDRTVVEVFNIVYRLPVAFSTTPAGTVGGGIGIKPMPGRITVTMIRV